MIDRVYTAKDAVSIDVIKGLIGEQFTLTDADIEVQYRLLAEFMVDDHPYAVLQSENHNSEEYELFRIEEDEDGFVQLVSIDDDDEWEAISEVYDELSLEP